MYDFIIWEWLFDANVFTYWWNPAFCSCNVGDWSVLDHQLKTEIDTYQLGVNNDESGESQRLISPRTLENKCYEWIFDSFKTVSFSSDWLFALAKDIKLV